MSTQKRKLESDLDSDSENEVRDLGSRLGLNTWPRFLVVEAKDGVSLPNFSPFAVQKWFEGISPDFAKIKKLKDGNFFVECSTKKASDSLRKRDGSNFISTPIKVSIHRTLNSSRGVIRCADLKDLTETEIREQLARQGVTQVKRVFITKESKKVPTNTLFLTFALTDLPKWIKVGYLQVKVDPFIPTPLRCFKCQRFGHHSKNCKSEEMCRFCAQIKHEGECLQPAHCVNCDGNHPSSSRECPKWKLEQEIQKVRLRDKCSFLEAKAKVSATIPNPKDRSFASIAASNSTTKQTCPSHFETLEKALALLTSSVDSLVNRVLALEGIIKLSQPTNSMIEQNVSESAKASSNVSSSAVAGAPNPAKLTRSSTAKGDSASSPGLIKTPAAPLPQKPAGRNDGGTRKGRPATKDQHKERHRSKSVLDSDDAMEHG